MHQNELNALSAKVDEAELEELLTADVSGGTNPVWLTTTTLSTLTSVPFFPTSACTTRC